MKTEEITAKIVKSEFIFLDHEKFRNRLQIDQSMFSRLMTHNNLADVIQSPKQKNTEEDKLTLNEIYSVMNGLGQLSFGVMVAVQTSKWTPGSLKLLSTEGLNISVIINDLERLFNSSPVRTDSLLGLMAWELLELLIYPCLKIAYADGEFCEDEREMIISLLSEEWGYHRPFVEYLILETEPHLEKFNYKDFCANINEICRIFPEINCDASKEELLVMVKKVILADGFVHPNEQAELDHLKDYLSSDEKRRRSDQFSINSLWGYIFKDDKSDKDLKVIDILKQVPLFDHLTKRELKTISTLVHSRTYQTGEYVFKKDDPGAAMFIIKKGALNIVLPEGDEKEIHLATLKSGTFVGELALLDNSPRSASAKASEPTEALAFFRSELNKLLTTYPSIGSKIMRKLALIIGQRLKATNEQLYKKN
ncbi:MAG: cyclic nucleotide-binding domain-containing protein [SAR324 cluster bacterium]|nr:cyclic nucleotide-binding domain-containing protein [SAR324 cluster bacterium]